jgi:hypothetical protein
MPEPKEVLFTVGRAIDKFLTGVPLGKSLTSDKKTGTDHCLLASKPFVPLYTVNVQGVNASHRNGWQGSLRATTIALRHP